MEVSFQNVTKKYGEFNAVKNLNLKIENGALHFLLGPSGCGKTTTLRMLAGLETVSSGKILIGNEDFTDKPSAARGLGMVFQNYALWPHMTVIQNIMYGLKLRKLSKKLMNERLEESLEMTRLIRFKERYPGQLSGGQQQRVALARALAIKPKILLLDEPLSNLDAKLRLEMRDNISRIHRETGITTIYVTHDQKEALSMGSHISVLHAGIQVQTGTPRDLYLRPKSPFLAEFIGETNLIEAKVTELNEQSYTLETPYGSLVAKKVSDDFSCGDKVCLSIRPESIRIDFSKKATEVENKFEALFENLTYLGDMEQIELKNQNQDIMLKANVFNAPEHGLKSGDKVVLSIKASEIIVLKPETKIGPGT